MLAYLENPLSWRELIKRTIREVQDDNGFGLAAQLAFYFFLALFPALLFLLALASFLPAEDLVARVVALLQGVAPEQVIDIIRDQLNAIGSDRRGGILTLGVAGALWSSSAAMVAVIDSLNRAYDVEESRPWWRQRLTAVLLTIGVALFLLVSIALVVVGPELAGYVADRVGLGAAFEWTWKLVQWPLVVVLVATAFGLIYYFAPNVDQDFVWLTPGSLIATGLWLVGSLAFRVYVVNFGSYEESYGTIGGVIVALLWLYMSGLVIVIGAEVNAEIDHASPHAARAAGDGRVRRKAVGPRAARAAAAGGRPVREAASPAVGFARTGAVVSGAIATAFTRRVRS